MIPIESLSVVGVDYNRPVLESGLWRASCDVLDVGRLSPGDLVLAVTEVPGEGFVARVRMAPFERGSRLDPHTGQPKTSYAVVVEPVDLTPLKEEK